MSYEGDDDAPAMGYDPAYDNNNAGPYEGDNNDHDGNAFPEPGPEHYNDDEGDEGDDDGQEPHAPAKPAKEPLVPLADAAELEAAVKQAASERAAAAAAAAEAEEKAAAMLPPLTTAVIKTGLSQVEKTADGLGVAFTRLDLIARGVQSLDGDLPAFRHLKHVNISQNSLSGSLSALAALPELVTVNMQHNRITTLPALDNCTALQVLQVCLTTSITSTCHLIRAT